MNRQNRIGQTDMLPGCNPAESIRFTENKSVEEAAAFLAGNVIETLREAIRLTELLSQERSRSKQSNSRVNCVAKELKELIKVISTYWN